MKISSSALAYLKGLSTMDDMSNYVAHEYPDIDADGNPWPTNKAERTVTISKDDFQFLMGQAEKRIHPVGIWLTFCLGALCGGAMAGGLMAVWHWIGGMK